MVSSSKSSNVDLKEELGRYLDQISSGLEIEKYFFLDQDSSKVNNLIKSKGGNLNIIIHPIFFFEGFLYKMNIKKFKDNNVKVLKPISQYEKVIDLIVRKLKS